MPLLYALLFLTMYVSLSVVVLSKLNIRTYNSLASYCIADEGFLLIVSVC